jgi:hypothetical protein
VSPVKYELLFYIPEDDFRHSHRRENLKSYVVPSSRILVILIMEGQNSTKRWFLQEQHGVTSKKTALFKVPPPGKLKSNKLK